MIRVFNQYVSVKSILLIGLESLLIVMSVVLGARLRFWNEQPQFWRYTRSSTFLLQILTVFLVLEVCCYYYKLYDLDAVHPRIEQFTRLARSFGASYLVLCLLCCVFPNVLPGRGVLFITLALAAATISAMRLSLDLFWHITTRQKNVLILGDGKMARTLACELERRADLNFRLLGHVAPERSRGSEVFGYPILGGKDELPAIVRQGRVSRIIVALDDLRGALPTRELVRLRIQGVEVEDAHSALAALTGRVWLRDARPSWFVFSTGFQRSNTTLLVKRLIDLALSLAGILLFFPAMCLIAIAIRLDSPGPVLYRQQRVGLGGRVFELIKFRSMRSDAEAENGAQWAQQDDQRVTCVGWFLRKYRLDELPQFLNVIRGEMSFVGPRPERPVFVEQLREQIPFYDERHSVRPGVTGWAQVQYTYGSSVEDAFRKLEYDLFYLRSLSIAFDIAIVFRTIRVVLFGHGR